MPQSKNDVILEVKDLKMHFPIARGLFRKVVGMVKAVDGISFVLKRETLGLVGERLRQNYSWRCISRLYQPTSGKYILKAKYC